MLHSEGGGDRQMVVAAVNIDVDGCGRSFVSGGPVW